MNFREKFIRRYIRAIEKCRHYLTVKELEKFDFLKKKKNLDRHEYNWMKLLYDELESVRDDLEPKQGNEIFRVE